MAGQVDFALFFKRLAFRHCRSSSRLFWEDQGVTTWSKVWMMMVDSTRDIAV
jgi:hypothetical protein